ncbi:hypothetical protein MMC17_008897 [Xylographa soralifera]|nr:hypothetical protein [Xylographa soralifera]
MTREETCSSYLSSLPQPPTVIGSPTNFWLYTVRDGFDLTHPLRPNSKPIHPRVKLETSNTPITIAPVKTALLIVDMQNFFLSKALGRDGTGHKAEEALLEYGIPAARAAGIQIVWITWGLMEHEIEALPPIVHRMFGFSTIMDGSASYNLREQETGPSQDLAEGEQQKERESGVNIVSRRERMTDGGIGDSIGDVYLGDGTFVDGGRLLVCDQWNTALHPPLEEAYQNGLRTKVPDIRFHKNRTSGMCDAMPDCTNFLTGNGFTTLLFTGVNTDQCVLGTLQDANLKGFDTVLLKDGCGTNSPDFTRKTCEYNCGKTWGFVSSCENLARGVESLIA